MTNLQSYSNPSNFLKFNKNRLKKEYFQHYHINKLIADLLEGKGNLHDAYNIIGSDGTDILALWADQLYFIYANKWNEEAIEILKDKINLQEFEINIFRGQKSLIINLLNVLQADFEIINNRIIYECDTPNLSNTVYGAILDVATESDFEEAVKMFVEYFDEDFGKGHKSKHDIEKSVQLGIMESKIYTLKVKGRIVSIARIINSDKKNVMIGSLYTNVIDRQKRYAENLIAQMTKKIILDGAEKCGLLTESTNIRASKAFENAGYKNIFEWVNILIK